LLLIDKRRPQPNVAEVLHIIGDPSGKTVIIVDDLIDTGGTFVSCVKALKEAGAQQIYGICTHPVFSGNAIERIENAPIENLFVSDTIPLQRHSEKIEVCSIAKIFAEAIIRTHNNRSISSLFEITDF